MWKLICLFLITLTFLSYAQSTKQDPWLTQHEYKIPSDLHTKIVITSADSAVVFTLFDNILEREQKVIFILQPNFFLKEKNNKDEIVLPFPKLQSGLYTMHYSNPDTSYVEKVVFLK